MLLYREIIKFSHAFNISFFGACVVYSSVFALGVIRMFNVKNGLDSDTGKKVNKND